MFKGILPLVGKAVLSLALTACNQQADQSDISEPLLQHRSQNQNEQFVCSTPIAGGATKIEVRFPQQCSDCALSAPGRVIGGDPNRAGLFKVDLGEAQDASVRVTAQQGLVYPAGSRAGAMFRFAGGTAQSALDTPNWRVIVRAYMDDQLIAVTNTELGSSYRRGTFEDDNKLYIYTQPLQAFNAVEFEFANEFGRLQQRAELFEMCADL